MEFDAYFVLNYSLKRIDLWVVLGVYHYKLVSRRSIND